MRHPLFLLCPGEITSISDGDRHYIGERQLCDLYGVRRQDCVVRNDAGRVMGLDPYIQGFLKVLRPLVSGNYERLTALEVADQMVIMDEAYRMWEQRQREARWIGIPVKNAKGDIIGRVTDAKICYNPERAEVTLEVEPSFARYLIANEPKGGFSVGH